MITSNEMFYVDADGNKQDADLHADMLDDPSVKEDAAVDAVLRAIKKGYTRKQAVGLFGNSISPARLAEVFKDRAAA